MLYLLCRSKRRSLFNGKQMIEEYEPQYFRVPSSDLSSESLEKLVIAAMMLTDSSGLLVRIPFKDLFQPWFIELLPVQVKERL